MTSAELIFETLAKTILETVDEHFMLQRIYTTHSPTKFGTNQLKQHF